MTDDERARIAADARSEANLENRLKNLEGELGKMQAVITWGVRTIWAAAGYLALQLWNFISSGGALK
jgi:hypothetical protein